MQGENDTVEVNVIKKMVITMKVWDEQLWCKDQYIDWLTLKLVKKSNHIEVSYFLIANGYHNEPEFRWWLHKAIKKRYIIISKVKSIFKNVKKYTFNLW